MSGGVAVCGTRTQDLFGEQAEHGLISVSDIEPRPYKQVARAKAQERTRDALLDAALDEFVGDRWQKTSLEALSARAGVTKQTLLRHFGSKDGLLMQALIHGASQVFDQRWSVPAGDIDGAVENLLDHYEEWGERSLRIGAWQSGPTMLAKLSQMARQVHYDWVEYVFEPWLEGLEEPARARRRATLIALCDVHTWHLLAHDLGLARAELHATLTDALKAVVGESR
jgi:AcrR family transcriptional regulator